MPFSTIAQVDVLVSEPIGTFLFNERNFRSMSPPGAGGRSMMIYGGPKQCGKLMTWRYLFDGLFLGLGILQPSEGSETGTSNLNPATEWNESRECHP